MITQKKQIFLQGDRHGEESIFFSCLKKARAFNHPGGAKNRAYRRREKQGGLFILMNIIGATPLS